MLFGALLLIFKALRTQACIQKWPGYVDVLMLGRRGPDNSSQATLQH